MPVISVTRTGTSAKATLGQIRLDRELIGVTLEDPANEGKGPIPTGTYQIVLSYSERFQALLPELLGVPGFTGIRIHAGNTSADTAGCLLVGRYVAGEGEIGDSRRALGVLLARWPEWHDDVIEVREA